MSNKRKAITRLTLDLAMPDIQKSVTCTLGDINRKLNVLVTNGGDTFEVLPQWSVILSGTKPDGTVIFNGCVVDDGNIIYDFESGNQISTCAGGYGVTLWIFDEDGDPVATPKFWINVIDSGIEQILESNDQFTVLQDLVGDIAALQEKDKQVDAILEELRNLIGNGGGVGGGGGGADLTSIITNLSKLNIENAQMKEDIEELQDNVAKNTASIESILQNGVGGGETGGSGASVTTGQFMTNFDAPAKMTGIIIRSLEPGTTIFFMPASQSSRDVVETIKVKFEPSATKGSDGYYRVYYKYEENSTQKAYINWIAIKDPASTFEPRVALVGVDIVGASGGGEESGTGSGSGTGGSTGGSTTTTDIAQTGEFTLNPDDWGNDKLTSVSFPSATNGTLTIIKPKTSADNAIVSGCNIFMVWGVWHGRVEFMASGSIPTNAITMTWITVKSSNTSTSPMVIFDANKGSGSGGSADLSSITASLTSLTNTVTSLGATVRDLTHAGTITIFSSDWNDGAATYAYSNAEKGTVTLLTPLNSTVRDEVARCKMWATVTEGSLIIHLEDDVTPPQATMIFSVFTIKDKENTSYAPMAAIVGVNVNGEGGGTGDVVPVTCDTESTFNSWTVYPSNWADDTPYEATKTVAEAVNGTVTFVIPIDADTRAAASTANMWVDPIVSDGKIVLKRLQSSVAPSKTMKFTLFTVKDNNASVEVGARAVLLGVDAVGSGGDGTVDLTEIKEDIAEMTTLSSCTIYPNQWTDSTPEKAIFTVSAAEKGTVTFVLPAITETRDEVARLGITIDPEFSETKVNEKTQYVLNFFRENTELQTDVYLNFILFTIKDKESTMPPRAVMVGAEALTGYDGGGVDLSAVEYLTDINTITIARSEWEDSNGTAKYTVSKYVDHDNTATMILLSPKDEDTLTEAERCNIWSDPVCENGKININRPVGISAPEHDLVFSALIVKDYEQRDMESSVATVSLVGVRSEGSGFGDVDLTELQRDIDKAHEDISKVATYTTVFVHENEWNGTSPYTATINCSAGTGTITLVAPKDGYTRGQAKACRIEVNPAVTDGKITLTTGTDVGMPSGTLTFVLFTIYDKERTAGNEFAPCAALVGVDAVGEGGGGDIDVPPEVFSEILTIGVNDWSGGIGAKDVNVSAAGKDTNTLLVPYNTNTRDAVIANNIYVDPVVSENGDITIRYTYEPDKELKFFTTTVKDLKGTGNAGTAAIVGVDYIKPPETYYRTATIAASAWNTVTHVTVITIDRAVNGTATLVLPADEETRKEAASHRLSVNPDASGGNIIFTYGSEDKPDTDLAFTIVVVQDLYGSRYAAKAALVGVDAVGGGGGAQGKMEYLTISMVHWSNSKYQYSITDDTGAVVLVMPADSKTKEKAEAVGLFVEPKLTDDNKVVFTIEKKVDDALNFIVFTIPAQGSIATRVALVGVDKQGGDDDWDEDWDDNVRDIIDTYLKVRDDELEARVQALEVWQEPAEGRLESVETGLDELTKAGGRLDSIERNIIGHSGAITSINNSIKALGESVGRDNAIRDTQLAQHEADIENIIAYLERKPIEIDLRGIKVVKTGAIKEIFSDGSEEITTLSYDDNGRVVSIKPQYSDEITITW